MTSPLDPPCVHPCKIDALASISRYGWECPYWQVIRSTLGHPSVLAPAVDVVVDDLGEVDGGVEGQEGVEGSELGIVCQERVCFV